MHCPEYIPITQTIIHTKRHTIGATCNEEITTFSNTFFLSRESIKTPYETSVPEATQEAPTTKTTNSEPSTPPPSKPTFSKTVKKKTNEIANKVDNEPSKKSDKGSTNRRITINRKKGKK